MCIKSVHIESSSLTPHFAKLNKNKPKENGKNEQEVIEMFSIIKIASETYLYFLTLGRPLPTLALILVKHLQPCGPQPVDQTLIVDRTTLLPLNIHLRISLAQCVAVLYIF